MKTPQKTPLYWFQNVIFYNVKEKKFIQMYPIYLDHRVNNHEISSLEDKIICVIKGFICSLFRVHFNLKHLGFFSAQKEG
jgi:hypothetical protein